MGRPTHRAIAIDHLRVATRSHTAIALVAILFFAALTLGITGLRYDKVALFTLPVLVGGILYGVHLHIEAAEYDADADHDGLRLRGLFRRFTIACVAIAICWAVLVHDLLLIPNEHFRFFGGLVCVAVAMTGVFLYGPVPFAALAWTIVVLAGGAIGLHQAHGGLPWYLEAITAGFALLVARMLLMQYNASTRAIEVLRRHVSEREATHHRERKQQDALAAERARAADDRESARLTATRTREQERDRHEAERHKELHRLADNFEHSLLGIVDVIGLVATNLEAAADQLAALGGQTQTNARAMRLCSDELEIAVSSVTVAGAEFSHSADSIAARVDEQVAATDLARAASVEGTAAIAALSREAEEIGAILGLIRGIASQTNLLALNATIEAARAGDAGRGFAVVAHEVKSLAGETEKAIASVGGTLTAVGDRMERAVATVESVGDQIEQVLAGASAIAAAVSQQIAATDEIGIHVARTGEGSRAVQDQSTQLEAVAGDLSALASRMREATRTMAAQSVQLGTASARFLGTLRSA